MHSTHEKYWVKREAVIVNSTWSDVLWRNSHRHGWCRIISHSGPLNNISLSQKLMTFLLKGSTNDNFSIVKIRSPRFSIIVCLECALPLWKYSSIERNIPLFIPITTPRYKADGATPGRLSIESSRFVPMNKTSNAHYLDRLKSICQIKGGLFTFDLVHHHCGLVNRVIHLLPFGKGIE